MISDVDQALRTVIQDEALRDYARDGLAEGSEVSVVFEAPTKEWNAKRQKSTVNLYLYDIREDLRRRERGWSEQTEEGIVVARRPAPRYFKLSYLVTAWVSRAEDEHHLLDSLLRAFLQYDALPARLVTGRLADTGLAVPLTIGLPPPEDRAFADVWSALGGELKPSLDLVLSVPIDTGVVYDVGPPVSDGMAVDMSDLVDGGTDRARRHAAPEPTTTRPPRARKRR